MKDGISQVIVNVEAQKDETYGRYKNCLSTILVGRKKSTPAEKRP